MHIRAAQGRGEGARGCGGGGGTGCRHAACPRASPRVPISMVAGPGSDLPWCSVLADLHCLEKKKGGGPWWHCQSGGQTHGERAMQREYDGERGVSSQALKIKPVSSNQLSCSWSVCGNFPDVWVQSGAKATSVAWEEQGWHHSGTPAQPRGLRTSSWPCWKHKMSP